MSTCTAQKLTGLEQRALAGAGSHWEGGDAVAVMEKRLGAACAGYGDGRGGTSSAIAAARKEAEAR